MRDKYELYLRDRIAWYKQEIELMAKALESCKEALDAYSKFKEQLAPATAPGVTE